MYDKVMICGDFNFPEIDWNTHLVSAGPLSSPSQFLNCVNDNLLIQHVKEFTRVRGSDEPSLIDLIITDHAQSISDSINYQAPLGYGDHCVLIWDYLVAVEEHYEEDDTTNTPLKWNVQKGDYDKLNSLLSDINWEEALQNKSLEECVDMFYNITHENMEKCIPKLKNTKTKDKDKPPWMDRKARKQIRKKSCAWRRYQQSKNYSHYIQYVKCRDKTTQKLRRIKKEFEKKLAQDCKKNPKAFYKYVNFKHKSNKKVIRLRNKDGHIAMSDETNANILNQFFSSVFNKEDDAPELIFSEASKLLWNEDNYDGIFNFKDKTPSEEINHVVIEEDIIKEHLLKIDPTKSNTSDCVHPRVLKECALTLASPLAIIFKKSMETGTVPPQWKKGTITPIHKGDSRHDASNYRPVTITSQLCRILEKIIKESMLLHLEKNQIITDKQHGFTRKRSCLSNLILNLEEITSRLDTGDILDQIYLDLQKAFDKVPHRRLIYKLKQYGINGNLLCWIESFLSHRQQRVKVRQQYSKWCNVESGVPQGSVLGPILFILYINDFPQCLKYCSTSIFADDTKLCGKANTPSDAEKIQEDLNATYDWCQEWMLKFNKKKCHVLHYGKKNWKHMYHLNGALITPVEEEKDLGVVISGDLKPHKNIAQCIIKANKVLGMMKRTFTYMDKDIFTVLYKVFIRPHLEYCQQAWSPYLAKDIDMLEKVQKRATKLVPSLRNLSYEERLKELKLYSLSDRRLRGDLILMYRIITKDIKINTNQLFTMEKNSKTRGHAFKVHVDNKSNSDIRRNYFTERVVQPWNNLPNNIVNSTTVKHFKAQYDKWCGLVAC